MTRLERVSKRAGFSTLNIIDVEEMPRDPGHLPHEAQWSMAPGERALQEHYQQTDVIIGIDRDAIANTSSYYRNEGLSREGAYARALDTEVREKLSKTLRTQAVRELRADWTALAVNMGSLAGFRACTEFFSLSDAAQSLAAVPLYMGIKGILDRHSRTLMRKELLALGEDADATTLRDKHQRSLGILGTAWDNKLLLAAGLKARPGIVRHTP
jgi:hypothetical protein